MFIDRRLISHFDWWLCALALLVAALGIATIYSASYSMEGQGSGGLALRQLSWLAVGVVAMILCFTFDYHHVDRIAVPFYVLVLALLVAVHFAGVSGGGSQRWLHLGFFALQPSELSKLAMVWVLTKFFKYDEPLGGYRWRDLTTPMLSLLPMVALVLWQPDLGTAVIIALVWLSVLLAGGLRVRSLVAAALAGLALIPVGWHFLRPYQQMRIRTFLNPDLDPLGAGYHVIQSKIAVGSGRWLGKGFLNGTQNRLEFLPAQHTDFIFSVFAEEWGFLGCLVLLLAYFALIYGCLKVAIRAKDRFGAILAFGITAIVFWQVVINIAMVTGVLPVVGIPLPLFSYGGSSLVSIMAGIGLLLNVGMRRFTF
jgi:rod shape determining protein RodA